MQSGCCNFALFFTLFGLTRIQEFSTVCTLSYQLRFKPEVAYSCLHAMYPAVLYVISMLVQNIYKMFS
jgi:hypothetical protein